MPQRDSTRPSETPLFLTLVALAIVIGLLIAAGTFVRSVVADSFQSAGTIRVARILAAELLREQLDEETGIRGYAAARTKVLLQPYYDGMATFPRSYRQVQRAVDLLGVRDAQAPLHDAAAVNRRWRAEIAQRILTRKKVPAALELRGKRLVDAFRYDIGALDAALAQREAAADAHAQRSILWVGIFAIWAIGVIIVAAVVFSVQQSRLTSRLIEERAEAELDRRKAAELQAAFDVEKRIADTLQGAFVQRMLPQLPTVRFSAAYIPATEETRVGGDWYDAVELPDDRVLLAIGDVTGHGIDAAVAMNKARQLLISCALIDPNPGPVLQRVNSELVRNASPVITAVTGVVDARKFEFSYAAAGHPPPVLLEPGGRARLLEPGALPLGVIGSVQYRTFSVQSVPGATLVLYTDGAIEHSRNVVEGEALLLQAVESAAASPETDLAKVISGIIFDNRRVADDVAIVTVRFGERRMA